MRLGTLGHPERAVVESAGKVTPSPDGWSLDWWIGADDRWHLPSEEVAVRQHCVDGAPVVETSMRVPGGDAVHRAFAASAGGESWVLVEVENRTAVPFAVAFAVLPPAPAVGHPGVYELEVGDRWIVANGSAAVWLPRAPNRAAAASGAEGGVLGTVTRGEAGSELPVRAVSTYGAASAAAIYPLPHTAKIRLVLPMRRASPDELVVPTSFPGADDVVRGWARHLEEGPRFELPDARLMASLTSSRAQALLDESGQPSMSAGAPAGSVPPPRPAPLAGSTVYDEVRRMLVREDRSGLVLAEGVPRDWHGAGWEVHDLPTVFGTFGYAVRWHGSRPALLWELRPHAGVGTVTLTAPSLDPDWSTTAPRGEVLLASSSPG